MKSPARLVDLVSHFAVGLKAISFINVWLKDKQQQRCYKTDILHARLTVDQ